VQTTRIAQAIGSQSQIHGDKVQVLPEVTANRISGFIEALASTAYVGQAELAKIAAALGLSTNEILQIAAALHILEFGELKEGAVKLTAAGRAFAEGSTEDRKRIFEEHLLRFVPLAAHIRQVLDEREEHRAPRERFDFELQDHLNRGDADQTLQTVIEWGRYAEIFTYDDRTKTFGLEHAAN